MVASLEMLSGRSKKEYAREAQSVADAPDEAAPVAVNGRKGKGRAERSGGRLS